MDTRTSDLFDLPPIARRRDPSTSKEAAEVYTRTSRQGDKDTMLRLIREAPGHTAGEYGHLLRSRGMPAMKAMRMPTRRISELRATGLIRVTGTRKCTQSGRRAQIYEAVTP